MERFKLLRIERLFTKTFVVDGVEADDQLEEMVEVRIGRGINRDLEQWQEDICDKARISADNRKRS